MALLQWKVGRVTITRVVESENPLDPTVLLPEATPEALAAHRDWLEPHFLTPEGQILLSVHGLVIDTGDRKILVDTCIGERPVPGYEFMDASGRFLEDLAAAGFPRETIDTVLCTHLHFDHVGWNTMREGDRWVPTFPNARYLFARVEWEHWSAEHGSPFTPTLDDAVRPIVDAGLADLVERDHRVCDEVSLEATPGHTPGHVVVHIASDGERAMITGDMTHHPVQWAEPDWAMHADSDAAQATRTRKRITESLVDRPTLLIGTHYAAPCAGHLVRSESGVRFRAKR
jgi:glyoxylase-like metal-dependent hydrolase (beta-lactamase superfamily II)